MDYNGHNSFTRPFSARETNSAMACKQNKAKAVHACALNKNILLKVSQVALVEKNLLASEGDVRDVGLIPGSGRYLGGGHGNPLQCSCLENPIDTGAWRAIVYRVTKNQT